MQSKRHDQVPVGLSVKTPERALKTTTVQWMEPAGARLFLLRLSGGLRTVFLRDLIGTGAPIVSILSIVWLFAVVAGANVLPFLWAILLFAAFGAAVSVFVSLAYLVFPQVQITPHTMTIGPRRVDQKSIIDHAWEKHLINGSELAVLHVSTRRGSIRVALPRELPRDDVERVVGMWGMERDTRPRDQ